MGDVPPSPQGSPLLSYSETSGGLQGGKAAFPLSDEIGENPANPRQKVRTCPIFVGAARCRLDFPGQL